MNKNITLQAEGDFTFKFYIEKAMPIIEKEMEIMGVASTVNTDHDNERMAKEALISMANVINKDGVPLRMEHMKTDDAIVGRVYEAEVDERNQLRIKARLDSKHPVASIMYDSIKKGMKMGFSVGGRVKNAVKEFSEATGKMVKTFYDVVLDEVSLTQRPANYDSWLISKSIMGIGEDGDKYLGTAFYKEYLNENPLLDYVQSFAKSIPDKSWVKVDDINNISEKNMEVKKTGYETSETETKTKAAETETTETETKTKSVSPEEFNSFKSVVAKGFESLTSLISKMTSASDTTESETKEKMSTEAKDSEQPDKDKTETEVTAKQREGQEDEGGNGATTATREETGGTSTETVGAEEVTNKKKGYGSEYEMKIKSATERIEAMTKAMSDSDTATETETKTKNAKEGDATETEETETTKSQIDQFVDTITKFCEAVVVKNQKDNISIPGFHKSIADAIKQDSGLQDVIKSMVEQPGFKKSVSMGVPYMVTKDGKRFALRAEETVEKSQKDNVGKSFKDVYKSDFSSVKAEE
jgi:hypothetical protein